MRQKTHAPKTKSVLKLRKLRRDREMTQEALAERVSVSKQHINEIERGKVNPSLDLARKLAGVFDVTIDDAFSYVEIQQ